MSSSDFISEETGLLRFDDAVWEMNKTLAEFQAKIAATSEERARRAGRVFAVSKDGYYNSDLFLGNYIFLLFCVSCVSDPLSVCLLQVTFSIHKYQPPCLNTNLHALIPIKLAIVN